MAPARKREGALTKEAILRAAEELFADKGFAGTSISQIAQKSGCSGPLIVFHFKDKRRLYEAVKAAIVQRSKSHLEPPEIFEDFASALRSIVASMFAFYKNNPTMIRLANWGRLEGDDDDWPGEDEPLERYLDVIHQGQRRGQVRSDLSPQRILIMISGTIHIWWEYHDRFMRDLGPNANPEIEDQRYYEQLIEVLLRGVSC